MYDVFTKFYLAQNKAKGFFKLGRSACLGKQHFKFWLELIGLEHETLVLFGKYHLGYETSNA